MAPSQTKVHSLCALCNAPSFIIAIFHKVDLEVVGDEGEVKLVTEDFNLNDWMVEKA